MQRYTDEFDAQHISIFETGGNYLVFNPDHALLLRSRYRIPGSLVGTLPQSPQQNVFTSLPMQLMPEEAILLTEAGVACIFHDVEHHQEGFCEIGKLGRNEWKYAIRREGLDVAKSLFDQKEQRRLKALREISAKQGRFRESSSETLESKALETAEDQLSFPPCELADKMTPNRDERSMESTSVVSIETSRATEVEPYGITPTTSCPPLSIKGRLTQSPFVADMPVKPQSYPLFRHLHNLSSQTYYLTPGLRFGCQYLVYPGDPLRFHSHFLACYFEWEDPMDLLTIIGGGRLGTGVKKGFLIGGVVPERADELVGKTNESLGDASESSVRCFCIEWSGM